MVTMNMNMNIVGQKWAGEPNYFLYLLLFLYSKNSVEAQAYFPI